MKRLLVYKPRFSDSLSVISATNSLKLLSANDIVPMKTVSIQSNQNAVSEKIF